VRIEIPGEKKCLQIAEVEIMSGGKNIAKGGKATQSTTGMVAMRSRRWMATRIRTGARA
jgi:hypothetical protein